MNLAVGLPPLAPGEFRFTTKALVPEQAPEGGQRRFRTIASSTIRDMQGDEMKLSALEDMAQAFRAGVNIFMNHKYDAPDSGFGMSDSAEIKDSGLRDPKTGTPIYDLHIAGFVDESNPKAVQLHNSMMGGMRWGTSVGAIVTKHRKNEVGRYDIDHVNLKEGSIVGVPMNQRSYVQKGDDGEIIEADLPRTKSWVAKAANAAAALDDATIAAVIDDDDDDETVEHDHSAPETDKSLDTDSGDALQVQGLGKGGKCPTCGSDEAGDCTDDYHAKSIDTAADLGDTAKVAGDDTTTEDTSTDGQAAEVATPEPEGAPEAEGATPGPAADEAGDEPEPETAKGYDPEDVLGLARRAGGLANTLAERDAEITSLKADNERLASELEQAGQVIKKMLALPLSRKAVGHVVDLDKRLPSVLAPEVKDFLTKSAGDNT